MPLFVHSLQTHVLDLNQQKTVSDVKGLINEREGLSSDQMAVYYEGQPLQDDCQLASFKNDSTLNIEMRLLGEEKAVPYEILVGADELNAVAKYLTGNTTKKLICKVHGSLARAGKVRGQTPKVEKQEKKKSKTGRAKRRIQYNRRFVSVVAVFGRKKGPNARS